MTDNRSNVLIGISSLEQVKTLNSAPIRINPNFTMPKIKIHEKNAERNYTCTCCGKTYQKQDGNFLKSGNSILWQANNGYIPICKVCAESIFNGLVDFYTGNEEHALRHWCEIFDYFYDVEASAMTATQVQVGRSRVFLYPAKLNTRQVKSRGVTYIDTIRNEAKEAVRIQNTNDILASNAQKDEDDFSVTDEMTKKWGYGHSVDEYEWLEEQEKDWRRRVEYKSKAQEELIRMACIAQLNVRRAEQKGGKIAESMKAFQDILASCNLQPRQNQNDDIADQNTFGTLIKQFEQEQPIPEPDPEWKDVDNIKKYVDAFFLGHLCELVHINNDCTEAYEQMLKEYTVTPPTYDGDDDAVDVSILDKFSNKGEKQ